ncbi:MAG: hypothetical protein AAGG44_19805, partial [Planctomycetota bacterium]
MKVTTNDAKWLVALLVLVGLQATIAKAQNLSVPVDRIVDTLPPDRDTVHSPEFDFPAFTYFDNNVEPDSIINSYLLGYLSDRIYAEDQGYDQAWVDAF